MFSLLPRTTHFSCHKTRSISGDICPPAFVPPAGSGWAFILHTCMRCVYRSAVCMWVCEQAVGQGHLTKWFGHVLCGGCLGPHYTYHHPQHSLPSPPSCVLLVSLPSVPVVELQFPFPFLSLLIPSFATPVCNLLQHSTLPRCPLPAGTFFPHCFCFLRAHPA